MQSVILCETYDAKAAIDEERLNWIYKVLRALKVPEEILKTKQIDEYRSEIEGLGIEVELVTNGDVNVYKKTWYNGESLEMSGWLPVNKNNLVAQWKEPSYVKKVEGNSVYYEIHLNEWSSVRER